MPVGPEGRHLLGQCLAGPHLSLRYQQAIFSPNLTLTALQVILFLNVVQHLLALLLNVLLHLVALSIFM